MNNEDISALVDDEIAAPACAPLLDTLSSAEDARQTWSRYHLIGSVLRDAPAAAPARSAEVVAMPRRKSRIPTPLTGLAIAASVAALAVTLVLRDGVHSPATDYELAVQAPGTPPQSIAAVLTSGPDELAQAATPSAATVESLARVPANQVVPVGAYDQRLNGYLVNFNEQRARRGVPGVHPYVHIVGFETD